MLTIKERSKQEFKPSKQNRAASLRKMERLSTSPCMHTAGLWGEGKFCLDKEFSKNASYKQKIIFHLASGMSKKLFLFCLDGGSVVPSL